MTEYKASKARYTIGIILIALGLLFFLNNTGLFYLNLPSYIFSFYTLLLIAGILIVVHGSSKALGVIFIVIAGAGYASKIFAFIGFWDLVVPIGLLSLGVYIVLRHRNSSEGGEHGNQGLWGKRKVVDDDTISEVAIFGGGEKMVKTDNFKGGEIVAIFGGGEINLTGSKLAPGTQNIDVFCMFGGVELAVPRNWNVRVKVIPLFGGFSNKKSFPELDEQTPENDSLLVIEGLVLFGGGEIKYY